MVHMWRIGRDQVVAVRIVVNGEVLRILDLHAGDTALKFGTIRQVILGVDPFHLGSSRHNVLRAQSDGIDWAGFLAKTAEDAAQDVDLETDRKLLNFIRRMLTGFDVYALRRACRRAQEAGRATDLAVFAAGQKVFAFEALAVRGRLFWPLERIRLFAAGDLLEEDRPGFVHTAHDAAEIAERHRKDVRIGWRRSYFYDTHLTLPRSSKVYSQKST